MVAPDRLHAYDEAAPSADRTETATFALGCFWGPDATLGARPGVVKTRVGYAGGETADPTYRDLGRHSEAVQVTFDPREVGFADLLDVAVAGHDPRNQPHKRQYQNVLFYRDGDGDQRATIEDRLSSLTVRDVQTRVEPLDEFHLAEPYHQKYSLRSEQALWSAFEDAGYEEADVRESPAAAKLNADAAGKRLRDCPLVA